MGVTAEKCLQAWTNSLMQIRAKADIVFFGDSLTYYGDFSTVFPDKVVCNLGLRGDTLQGMIDRLEQVKILEPKQVFLMAGINDVATCPLEEFEKKYEVLIKQILMDNVELMLVIQSMLPINNREYKISCDNEKIIACNKIIERLSFLNNIKYIDLFSVYVRDGLLPEEMTLDGIHLAENAYRAWYNMIK